MSVWLTPDLKPIVAGTYFPPGNMIPWFSKCNDIIALFIESKYGQPGFTDILNRVASLWKTRRADLTEQADDVINQLRDQPSTIDEKGILFCFPG